MIFTGKIITGDEMKLVDLNQIQIAGDSKEDRYLSFCGQVKDPYRFRVGDIIVNTQFADTDQSMEDAFYHFFQLTVGARSEL